MAVTSSINAQDTLSGDKYDYTCNRHNDHLSVSIQLKKKNHKKYKSSEPRWSWKNAFEIISGKRNALEKNNNPILYDEKVAESRRRTKSDILATNQGHFINKRNILSESSLDVFAKQNINPMSWSNTDSYFFYDINKESFPSSPIAIPSQIGSSRGSTCSSSYTTQDGIDIYPEEDIDINEKKSTQSVNDDNYGMIFEFEV